MAENEERRSRREELIRRLALLSIRWMGGGNTFSTPAFPCRLDGGNRWGSYFLFFTRNGEDRFIIRETIGRESGEQRVFRTWTFVKDSAWDLVKIEKNGVPVRLDELKRELEDIHQKIEKINSRIGIPGLYFDTEITAPETFFDIPLRGAPEEIEGTKEDGSTRKRIAPRIPLVVAALVVAVSLTVVAVNNGRYKKLRRATDEIAAQRAASTEAADARCRTRDAFIEETVSELQILERDSRQDRSAFEFNRRNAYVNVTRLAAELTRNLPARKEAYRLIADNIMEAESYGEIIYEISRLPSEEYQARIFLATDRQKVETLSRLLPAFPHLLYPVRLPDEPNNGRGFRITSGYMDRRVDPIGSRVVNPHYAVDIINVSNIAFINYSGEIIREGNHPGYVVSVAEGTVADVGSDDGFGWFVEIDHEIVPAVRESYNACTALRTFYAHLETEPALKAGDHVSADQILGEIGNSGQSTGPHLHFEVRIYNDSGMYRSADGRFDKINPFLVQKR
jgi:murein DD-endopeptidase MepM/ murein hydrolase activator NlpD